MEAGLGRGGIDAGFGRGMPDGLGRPPPPGRDPCVIPNGLLPPLRGGRVAGPGAPVGRGPAGPGRGPSATPGPGAGRCGAAGRGPLGPRSCAARTAASCSAFSWAARASAAATSMSWALVGLLTGVGGPGIGAFLAGALVGSAVRGLRGGVGLAPGFPAAGGALGAAGAAVTPAASMVARSRRATGASIVLDADLTYSPISWSFASTILLSTPSSFASSCTRGLPATALLILRPAGAPLDLTLALEGWSSRRSLRAEPGDPRRRLRAEQAAQLQRLHRVLMSVVLPCWSGVGDPHRPLCPRSWRHTPPAARCPCFRSPATPGQRPDAAPLGRGSPARGVDAHPSPDVDGLDPVRH
jgi:hypothetical protein